MSSIITITANPAIDVLTQIHRIAPFSKLRCGEARRDPGGGGINVARVLRRLGVPATALYTAGGLYGELLKGLVEREGIASLPIPIRGETREDFTVIETASGREFRFVLPGPDLNAEECRAILEALSDIDVSPGFVVISGSLPPGTPPALYVDLVRAAKKKGAQTVLDTSGIALEASLREGVDLAKPNLRELRELMRAPLEHEAEWLKAARALTTSGQARIVVLTLGERGALLTTQERAWRAHAPKLTPISTVGAGDSFLAAIVSSLAAGRSLDEALRYGVAAGTAALLLPGTELCRRDDVERLAHDVRLEELVAAPA
jgi:6-phosphofructokinase 2